MAERKSRPPAAAEWILKRTAPQRWADAWLGDFHEAFEDVAERRGRAASRIWYWGQVFKSLPGFLQNRFYWSLSMLRNYWIIALRHMFKNKWFSLINLAGLSVGLAGVILIAAYVRFELSYDRFHENSGRIFRILNFAGPSRAGAREFFDACSDPKIPGRLAAVPEVVGSTQTGEASQAIIQKGTDSFIESGLYADDRFLKVFSFPLRRGDPEQALAKAGSIVLTEATARKLFGSGDPIGQSLTFRSQTSVYPLIVSGIAADVPENSHLRFAFLVSLATLRADPDMKWMFEMVVYDFLTTYVELRNSADRAAVEAKLAALAKSGEADKPTLSQFLQPLIDIHLYSQIRGKAAENNEIRYVRLFSAIALVLLLIAVVNYVNLATSRSAARAKEIGIRKVTGAARRQLFRQFIGESLLMSGAALILALAVLRVFWGFFRRLMGIELGFRTLGSPEILALAAGAALGAGLLAGLYPAFVLSSLQPIHSLRDRSGSGRKGSFLRSALVVFQFGASFVFLVGTFVIGRQMGFIRSSNLASDREKIIVLPIRTEGTRAAAGALREDFLENPDVLSVSLSGYVPAANAALPRLGIRAAKDDGAPLQSSCQVNSVDEDFVPLFGIPLLEGRNLRPGEKNAALINETMVREIGWKFPLGKTLEFGGSMPTATVVGVFRDFHQAPLQTRIMPLALIPGPFPPQAVFIRVRPGNMPATVEGLRKAFLGRIREQPFEFNFLDEIFDSIYRREIRAGEFFRVFAILAVFVACLGLAGLTAFTVERRTKEIGIRKILGASSARLTALLNARFVVLIIVSNVIALPLAAWAMNMWLRSFVYRTRLTAGTFVLASGIALAIALITISLQTVKAAGMNPAESLRHE